MISNKKGITPIISVILLLMMTIAIAGIAYTWLQGVQETIETSTENTSTRLLAGMNVNMRIEGYTLNCSSGTTASNVSIFVRNAGTEKANNVRLYVDDELQMDSNASLSTLSAGTTVTLNVTSMNCGNWNGTSRKIKVSSDEQVEETIMSFTCTSSGGTCP